MKNVLFILTDLQGGGAERVTLNLIRELNRNEFRPSLFLIKRSGALLPNIPTDVPVKWALQPDQRISRNIPKVIVSLIRAARDADVLVGALELTATYFAAIAGQWLNRPVIGWVHTNLKQYPPAKGFLHSKLLKWIYPRLTSVIIVSRGASKAIVELVPKLASKIKVINNLIPLNTIHELSKGASPFDKTLPVLISAGRLVYEKGFDILIKAHAKLISKGVKHRLIILGEGPEKTNLQNLVENLGVQNSILFAGFHTNPYIWIKNSTIFALSSRFEGFSLVLLEAMLLGIPVISTNCPDGPAEILEDGKYGKLVPHEDINSIAEAIESLLTNESLALHYKAQGLERAQHFSVERILPQFEKVLLES